MTRKIIIDTDPGQDDAIAILMACGLAKLNLIEILGITCVSGNVPVKLTSKNARIICDFANRQDIPIYKGAINPILKPLITATNIHGENGLSGVKLHKPKTKIKNQHAVQFLIETLTKNKDITICAIGPLTNLALAFSIEPKCINGIKELIIMGGAYFETGNITPRAEFNFFIDPIATQIVLNTKVKKIIIPLDVTHKFLIDKSKINLIKAINNNNSKRIASILEDYARYDQRKFKEHKAPLHDPCTIAYLIDKTLFNSKEIFAQIETNNTMNEGSISIDWYNKKNTNAHWCYDINTDKTFQLLLKAIRALD